MTGVLDHHRHCCALTQAYKEGSGWTCVLPSLEWVVAEPCLPPTPCSSHSSLITGQKCSLWRGERDSFCSVPSCVGLAGFLGGAEGGGCADTCPVLPVHRAPPGSRELQAGNSSVLLAGGWSTGLGGPCGAQGAAVCSWPSSRLASITDQALPCAPEFLTCPTGRGEAVTSFLCGVVHPLGCLDLAAGAAFSRSSRSGWLGSVAGMLPQLCQEDGLSQRGACAAPRGKDPLDLT